jgi:hypothetical protein
MLLNTAPYLSTSGSHLPKYRLPFPFPLHLIAGRKAAFALACWVGRHKPHWFHADSQRSSFVTVAERGEHKPDDLLYHATVRNLRNYIRDAGLKPKRADLAISRLLTRNLPAPVAQSLAGLPFIRDILVTNMEYLLVHDDTIG